MTAHPTAEWLANQLTEVCGCEQIYYRRCSDLVGSRILGRREHRGLAARAADDSRCRGVLVVRRNTLSVAGWLLNNASLSSNELDLVRNVRSKLERNRTWKPSPDQKKWLHALSQAAGDYARAWGLRV